MFSSEKPGNADIGTILAFLRGSCVGWKDSFGRAFQQLSFQKLEDAIRAGLAGKIMCYDENGAGGKFLQDSLEDFCGTGAVEPSSRLIQQQNLAAARKGQCEQQALSLAARELAAIFSQRHV